MHSENTKRFLRSLELTGKHDRGGAMHGQSPWRPHDYDLPVIDTLNSTLNSLLKKGTGSEPPGGIPEVSRRP